MTRYEFSEGKSDKFWEIHLEGRSLTVRFGRIGTAGQTQTKSFSSPELARKEHDRLVAEKLNKGYRQAGGGDAESRSLKDSSKAGSTQLRKDLYVYNEATGFLLTSRRMGGKGLEGNGKEWDKGVRNGDLIPIELIQDDPFTIRVVVGGELQPQEAEEWVGRLDWKLRVPDGNLVICGGAEYVMEEFEDEQNHYMAEYIRPVEVPQGEYRASIYMYMRGVNGKACLQAAHGGDEPDPYGEWFRRTRPGHPFPVWLHNDCVADPREDPGYEKEWKKAKAVEDPIEYYIEFLLHLTPLGDGDGAIEMPELYEGWFSNPTECRVPDRIPLGIAASDVEGLPKKPDPNAVFPIDVLPRVANFKRVALEGGPVEVPLDRLERLFRVAWFCHFWTMPQIRVQLPEAAAFAADVEKIEQVILSREGHVLDVRFEATGKQSGAIRQVASVSERLKALPEGSVIELVAAYGDEENLKAEKPLGLHRYHGTVRRGVMSIEEVFPAVSAASLQSALALSAQVENGDAIDAGSEDIARAVLAYLKAHPFFSDNPAVQKGATAIAIEKPEPALLNFIAADVFKRGFADVWPLLDLEDHGTDDEEEQDELDFVGAPANGSAAPPRGNLLLNGESKRAYYASDARKLDDAAQKYIDETERDLRPLGFRLVGDIICSASGPLVIRGYAEEGGADSRDWRNSRLNQSSKPHAAQNISGQENVMTAFMIPLGGRIL